MSNTLHIIVSFAALGIAIMAFCGNPYSHSSDASLAIIGICTTLIVGISVIDRLTIKGLESKIEQLERSMSNFNIKSRRNDICFLSAWGLAYINWRPFSAFNQFLMALKITFEVEDAPRAKTCISLLKLTLHRLKILHDTNQVDSHGFLKIPENIPEYLSNSKMYRVFHKDIEDIFRDINDYVQKYKCQNDA